MAYEFKLPDVGEGIEEAQVLKWMLDVGDGVREDEPLAEVETDKAIIEVPSPVDGEVRRLHADEGETVEVGDPFVTFERGDGGRDARNDGGVEILDSDGNAAVDVDAEGSKKETSVDGGEEDTETSEATRRLAREIGVDPDEVEGSGKDGRVLAQDILHAAKDEQEEREGERGEEEDEDDEDDEPTEDDTDTVIPGKGGKTPTMEDDETAPEFGQGQTPAVDPDTAEETSMFGSETPVAERTDESEEVEDAREEEDTEVNEDDSEPAGKEKRGGEEDRSKTEGTGEDTGTETDTTETVTPETTTKTEVDDEETIDERKTTETGTDPGTSEETTGSDERPEGEDVEEAAEEAVPATESASTEHYMTHRDVADAERLSEARDELRDAMDTRLRYTPLLVKACAEALDDTGFLEVSDGIDIGVGVEGDEGVVVGVVENADRKGIKEIADETAELRDGVRSDDSYDEDDVTLTLLDIGAVGGEGVSPVVGLPGDAAVSVGEIRLRPSVVEGEVEPRHTAPLSVTFDGETADSIEVARFTNELKRYLSQPSVILLR